jgi:phosphoglycolate phosphatase
VRLVVFDCDGTLVDSQHMIVEAMRIGFAENGLPAPARALMLRQVGLSVPEAMQALTGIDDPQILAGLSAAYRDAFFELRRAGSIGDPLFPGTRETIEALAARDDTLIGIATGKSRRGVDALLAREGWQGLFATIQTADDAPSKPHPAMLFQAMAETGTGPDHTVMIGDTTYDMAMARAAHTRGIGVAWGYHEAAELIEAGAQSVIADFAELPGLLLPSAQRRTG